MKKYVKAFALMSAAFLVSCTDVSAKEMTVKEMTGENVSEDFKAYLNDADSIRIIGKHIFTDTYPLTGGQMYFAGATSVNEGEEFKLEDVYMLELEREYNEEEMQHGGWDYNSIRVALDYGSHEYNEDTTKFDIKFINTNEVEGRESISTSGVVSSFIESLGEDLGYTVSLDGTTIKALFNTVSDEEVKSAITSSGIIEKIYNFLLDNDEYESINIGGVEITLESLIADEDEGSMALDETKAGEIKTKLEALVSSVSAGTSFDLSFTYDSENYANKDLVDGEEPVYNIVIEGLVDVKEFFKTESEVDKYFKVNETGEQVLNVKNPRSAANGVTDATTPIVNVIKAALATNNIKKVVLTVGDNTYNFSTNPTAANLTTTLGYDGIKTWADLKNETINIKFELNDHVSAVDDIVDYDIVLDSYIDYDAIIDNIKDTVNAKYTENENYVINREGSDITINVKLNNNNLPALGGFVTEFGKAMYNALNNNGTYKGELATVTMTSTPIEGVEGNVQTVTVSTESSDSNSGFETAFRATLVYGTSARYASDLTVSDILGKEFTLSLTSTEENAEAVNYNVKFVVDGFNVETAFNSIKDNSNTYFDKVSFSVETGNLEINLSKLDALVSSVNGTGILADLAKYQGVIESVKIGTVTVDLTKTLDSESLKEIKDSIINELTGGNEDATLYDLIGNTIDVTVKLVDGINPSATEREVTKTIEFVSSYVVEANAESLTELIKSSSDAKVINLTEPVETDLTIENDNVIIIGSEDAVITGDVTVSAEGVTLQDVAVEGELKVTGEGATVEGGKVTGQVSVTGENATFDGVDIEGQDIEGDNKFVVDVDTTAENFTLNESTISYDKEADYAYGLVHAESDTINVTGNTFVIDNVKNPLEFGYSTKIKEAQIVGNTFTGVNYSLNEYESENLARNVISFYDAEANANILVEDNTFDYANWAVRITNKTGNAVTYKFNNNTVKSNTAYTNVNGENKEVEDTQVAFIGVQKVGEEADNITIISRNNKLGENTLFTYDQSQLSEENATLHNRLVYSSEAKPKVQELSV